jgi:DNA polymerase-1
MIYYVTKQHVVSESEAFKTTSSFDTALDFCATLPVIGIDFETTGLDFISDKPVLFAIGNHKTQFVINLFEFDLKPFKSLLESQEVVKIAHNVKFEYLFLKKHYGIELERVFDTMLASQLITCGDDKMNHKLDTIVFRYLKLRLMKTEQKKFIGKISETFKDSQIIYSADDIACLIPLMRALTERINELELQNVMYLENEAVLAFADIEYNGMYLNSEKWLVLAERSERTKHDLQKTLELFVEQHKCFKPIYSRGVQLDLFDTNSLKDFVNWDSPAQMIKVFQCLHPSIIDTEERTLLNMIYHAEFTDAIVEHSKLSVTEVQEFVKLYLAFKEASKAAGSYGRDFLRHIRADGKIHTSYRQILKTGRVSSSDPNMQQIPGNNEYRNCFEAPPGYSYVSADFSSQELAVIAYGSQDPVFLSALENGHDLHSVAAQVVYGHEWTMNAESDCAFYEKDANGNFKADYPDKDNHSIDATRYSRETDMIDRTMKFLR